MTISNPLPPELVAQAALFVNTLTQTDYLYNGFIDADAGIDDCGCNQFVACGVFGRYTRGDRGRSLVGAGGRRRKIFVFMHTNTFNNAPFYSNGASARFSETTSDTGK